MKKWIIGAVMLLLAGCAQSTENLIVTKPQVIPPPTELSECNLDKLPNEFKSNKDVARFMLRTYDNNALCKRHMDGIKRFYKQAQKDIEHN